MLRIQRVPAYQIDKHTGHVATCRYDVENRYKRLYPDCVIRTVADGWILFKDSGEFALWEEQKNVLPIHN